MLRRLRALVMEREWKPNVETSPNCPRCGSSNTKFCYYNNYSLTQPRYFCKGCRRYWTKGGSLRNVPVGGGCRKNRRGKSFRLSTDQGTVHSESSFGYGGSLPSYGHKVNSLVDHSTSSSMMPDGSHIDLALVYANYLNQQPDSKSGSTEFGIPELGSDQFDPITAEFSCLPNMNLDSNVQLPEENGLVIGCHSLSDLTSETHLSGNDRMYYSGLPPLPGEVATDQEILWSNSHMMVNHTLQATQPRPPVQPGPEGQDPDLLFGNWSPFDLSSDDTFPRN